MHKLHWFDGLFFIVAWLIIFQVILNFLCFLFNFQMYLESSVSISYFLWLNNLCQKNKVSKSATGSESERTRKRLIETFQDNGLSIASQANIASVNDLDITLNLRTGSYKPHQKPNNQPLCIDKYSTHPRHILNALLDTISKRI